MNWRDIKRKIRSDAHRVFGVPAVYLTHSGGAPLAISVRVHRKSAVTPVVRVDDFSNAASNMIPVDRIIFDVAQLPQARNGAFVFVGRSEVYRVGPTEAVDSGHYAAEVSEELGSAALVAALDLNHPGWDANL